MTRSAPESANANRENRSKGVSAHASARISAAKTAVSAPTPQVGHAPAAGFAPLPSTPPPPRPIDGRRQR